MQPATHVTIGDTFVTVRRKGQTTVQVAKILHDGALDGRRRIVLDRRLHEGDEYELGEWECRGPVVTELLAKAPRT